MWNGKAHQPHRVSAEIRNAEVLRKVNAANCSEIERLAASRKYGIVRGKVIMPGHRRDNDFHHIRP